MMSLVSPHPDRTGWALDDVEAAYREFRVHLVRLASLILGDPGRADELVHDVFSALVVRPPVLEDVSKVGPYLRRATLNRCNSEMKRLGTGRTATLRLVGRPTPEVAGPEERATTSDARRRVLEAVRTLPTRQRDVVLLRYYADLSESEIAETLHVSPGTVKSAAHRAMTRLAPMLEELR